MKFSLSWLKEYLDTTATLDQITQKLTAIGLEVEDVQDPAKTLKGFIVGEVLTAEKHPDADKLKCLIVNTGTEKLKVVCGAPNARAGMKGVFAPAGSYIPGSNITLKKSMIRGAESNGMMCSEKELCLSEESNGIIDLKTDLPAGADAAAALGLNDPVIEINLTPNRGDCAGVYGIARDLAAAGLGTLKTLATAKVAEGFSTAISVKIDDAAACPGFIGRMIKGVNNGASPEWMQKRLIAAGAKPISALVDITNYFCIGLNRPLHVFDADKIKGNLYVRLAKAGETLAALNDKTYMLQGGEIVICDDSGIVALGGVMGGAATGVSSSTKNVYLEVALFNPLTIAMTGQKLQIDSDAQYRFARGVDPAFLRHAADLATQMIIDICGGQAGSVAVAGETAAPSHRAAISYAPSLLKKRGGMELDNARQKQILQSLGFEVKDSGAEWSVAAPSWRSDVFGADDLVEEILRIVGYDSIPAVPVRLPAGESRRPVSVLSKRIMKARRTLAARGMFETVTWAFIDDASADLFGAHANQNKKALTLLEPISADMSVMRPSILPALIQAAGRNADRGHPDAALFEIGNIYKAPTAEGQIMTAAGVILGQSNGRHWSGAARPADVYDAKAHVLATLETLGVNTANAQISRDVPEWYHPGRSGAIKLGHNVLAYFGEIHPATLNALKREETCAAFEIFLPALPPVKKKSTRKELLRPSPLQPVLRDFAFIVDAGVEADKIIRSVKSVDKTLITQVQVFDIYQGKGVDTDKKSVAFSVTLQPVEKTLTDEDIAAISQKIIAAVTKDTGGQLRA